MNKININKKSIIISVHQPGYHRYIGYFYKLWLSDIFISFDTVQYVAREYQSRQQFFIDNKLKWLSVPTNSGREEIYKKLIVSKETLINHWLIIKYIYRNAPYFNLYQEQFSSIYHKNWTYLADFCDEITKTIVDIIGINMVFVRARDFFINNNGSKKAQLIKDTLKSVIEINNYNNIIYVPRAYPVPKNHYLNKKSTESNLLERQILENSGIKIKSYIFKHPIYNQCFGRNHAFIPNLGMIDLLFNEGSNSLKILKSCGNGILY